jgi:hypothetical protein
LTDLHLLLDFEAVANPDLEVRPSRRVHTVTLYLSSRSDLQIRIRHYFEVTLPKYEVGKYAVCILNP